MKRALAVWFGLMFAASAAEAVNIGVNIGYGGCGNYGAISVGAPVYYSRPVVYYPAPVVCRPVRPVYYSSGCGSSRPVYYSSHGYYARPSTVYYRPRPVVARPTYYYQQGCDRVVVRGGR